MVIAKTACRNVAFKTAKLGGSIFVRQSDILMPEATTTASSFIHFTHEEGSDDLGCFIYFCVFNQDAFEGCTWL